MICEPGQIYSANGGCTCPYNQYSYMGSCTPCWNNSSPSADLTTCTCLTGFTAQGTSCISDDKCPPGATWNPYNSSCFCVIPGQIYSGFGCTCGYYFVLNPKHECVCSSSTDNDCSCAGNYYYAPGIGCAPVLKLT